MTNYSEEERSEIEKRLIAAALEAEAAGYAVTWWTPEEIGEASAEDLLDTVIQRGNDYLADEKGASCRPDED